MKIDFTRDEIKYLIDVLNNVSGPVAEGNPRFYLNKAYNKLIKANNGQKRLFCRETQVGNKHGMETLYIAKGKPCPVETCIGNESWEKNENCEGKQLF